MDEHDEHAHGDRAGSLSGWLQNRRFAIVAPHLRGTVLDFGSHHGVLTRLCRPDAYLGIEIDDDFIATARRLHPEYEFLKELPPDRQFDTIAALAVIEHVKDPGALLALLAQALAPGGSIVLTTPHPRLEWVHTAGARIGLFSQHAHDDHEDLLDRAALTKLAAPAGLTLVHYKRFLLGANQMFVLRADGTTDGATGGATDGRTSAG